MLNVIGDVVPYGAMPPFLTSTPLIVPIGIALGVLVLAAVLVGVHRSRGRRRTGAADPQAEVVTPSPWQEPGEATPAPTVGAAVARALAAREARGGDARDRLLSVLLDDPVRAVGATVELDACRRQLDRLTDAVAHERASLRGVLTRLGATGLSADQLARLAGLPPDELRALLAGEGSAGDAVQPRR